MELKIINDEYALTVHSVKELRAYDKLALDMQTRLGLIDKATPLDLLLWDRPEGYASGKYRYLVRLKDGRTWRQDVVIPADGSEASMTHVAGDLWRLSEFIHVVRMRSDHCIPLIAAYGVSLLRVTYG